MKNASEKVTLSGYIDVQAADLDAVKAELPKHIRLTREEPGCLVFNVEPDLQRKNRFVVYEEFVNEEAYKFHQNRVMASAWGRITKNVKRDYNIRYG